MKIAPSVLSADFMNMQSQLGELNGLVDIIHFDVMDGMFVPNISFGPKILKDISSKTDFFYDVHLMIEEPHKYFDAFIKAGADAITFHYEAYEHEIDVINHLKLLKKLKIKTGISIKPKTKVETITKLLPLVDQVLVMLVEPGFGGQAMIESCVSKIEKLNNLKSKHNFTIIVDGGVNDKTINKVKAADVVVAGSFIFNGDIKNNVNALKMV